MPRSRLEIAEEIADNLRPLKRGVGDSRTIVLAHIKVIEKCEPMLAELQASSTIKQRAARAEQKIRKLSVDLGPLVGAEVRKTIERLPSLTNIDGGPDPRDPEGKKRLPLPDARFGFLQWLCAHQACVLFKELSEKQAVASQNSGLHIVAQLIYQAATGEPPSKAGLLRACKVVLPWRREHIAD